MMHGEDSETTDLREVIDDTLQEAMFYAIRQHIEPYMLAEYLQPDDMSMRSPSPATTDGWNAVASDMLTALVATLPQRVDAAIERLDDAAKAFGVVSTNATLDELETARDAAVEAKRELRALLAVASRAEMTEDSDAWIDFDQAVHDITNQLGQELTSEECDGWTGEFTGEALSDARQYLLEAGKKLIAITTTEAADGK